MAKTTFPNIGILVMKGMPILLVWHIIDSELPFSLVSLPPYGCSRLLTCPSFWPLCLERAAANDEPLFNQVILPSMSAEGFLALGFFFESHCESGRGF
jgi:hypothetical protein